MAHEGDPRPMPALRLSHKLSLAFAAVIAVVVGLVSWNLVATERLAREQRAIVEQALPAVRLEVTLLEAVSALRRLEVRYAVLVDRAYLRLFEERVRAMESDLLRLEPLLSTDAEREMLGRVRARLADYRAHVERRPTASPAGSPVAAELDAGLGQLYARSEAELRRREGETQALNEKSRLIAMVGLAASLLVGLAASLFALLRIARPLRQLRVATRDVARREFSEPIPVRGRDEVAELTTAFNQMAARLRELDTLKEELFSAISHDLRTPLAAIGWSVDLLMAGSLGTLTPKQARQVERIQASSNGLLELVNQILELGKLEAGKIELDLRPTDLRRVVEASVEEIRPLAEAAKLELEVTMPGAVPEISADGGRLHRVLVNLLGNAVKFTPAGGRVALSAELAGSEEVVVKVRDTGIGIPADLVPKVFDRYQQAHGGRGGTGIGLTVVKGLVEAHGGRIWLESEEGRGSCFTFTLPLSRRAG